VLGGAGVSHKKADKLLATLRDDATREVRPHASPAPPHPPLPAACARARGHAPPSFWQTAERAELLRTLRAEMLRSCGEAGMNSLARTAATTALSCALEATPALESARLPPFATKKDLVKRVERQAQGAPDGLQAHRHHSLQRCAAALAPCCVARRRSRHLPRCSRRRAGRQEEGAQIRHVRDQSGRDGQVRAAAAAAPPRPRARRAARATDASGGAQDDRGRPGAASDPARRRALHPRRAVLHVDD